VGASAISPDGRYVCGSYLQCLSIHNRAFVYDTQTKEFRSLPHPPGVYASNANDVNDAGLVAGTYAHATVSPPGFRGFVYDVTSGQYEAQLDPVAGGAWCQVAAINRRGTVCGTRSIGSPGDPVNPQTAFVWSATDGYSDLGTINGQTTMGHDMNEHGFVTGQVGLWPDAQPFIWHGAMFKQLGSLAGMETVGLAIQNDNWVVGRSRGGGSDGVTLVQPFLWKGTTLGALMLLSGYEWAWAFDISDTGIIVGSVNTVNSTDPRACVWLDGVPHDLNELTDLPGGAILTSTSGTNALGAITAGGRVRSSPSLAFILVPSQAPVGDLSRDGIVDVDDLLRVLESWDSDAPQADVNGDGTVDFVDLQWILGSWTPN
jgi:uncharacterized membrane protein